MQRIDIQESEVKKFIHWREDTYARNCIYDCPDFEIIALCWLPGQCAPIHEHGGQDCWVYMLSGELKETRFKLEDDSFVAKGNHICCRGDVGFMNESLGWHDLRNVSDKPAVSIHIYCNPIKSCQVYNESADCLEQHYPEYYTKNGTLVA